MPSIKNIFVIAFSTFMLLFTAKSNASIVVTGTIESKKLSEKYSLKNLSASVKSDLITLKRQYHANGINKQK